MCLNGQSDVLKSRCTVREGLLKAKSVETPRARGSASSNVSIDEIKEHRTLIPSE